ncbi:MAG: HNH endonuclease signature motif containing protein [Ilumatobacteraceae bacterium]
MKSINGWPGYFVTKQGIILSTKSNSGKCDKPPRELVPQPNKTGHLRIRLCNRGKTQMRFVHHLVLENFVGPRPDGLVARHLDGDPSNNNLGNLEWGTSSRNRLDMWEHGTMPHGSTHTSSKLTEEQVLEMRFRFAGGDVEVQELAQAYCVDPSTVGSALRGEYWGHVGGPIAATCRPSGDRHWRRKNPRLPRCSLCRQTGHYRTTCPETKA